MRAMLRQVGRAPARIAASVFALALAVAAMGVLAIPAVSTASVHEVAERDGLADIVIDTTPLDDRQVALVAALDGVVAAEGQVDVGVRLPDESDIRLVGLAFDADQTMDVVRVDAGRAPAAPGEVVTAPDVAPIGATFDVAGSTFDVVGHGTTMWWATEPAVFATLETARAAAPERGLNRLVITAADDGADALREVAAQVRAVLERDGDTFTALPTHLPDGSTPIDEDIEQVSTLIGLLGVAACVVALVLLASTTTTLVTERTREVAVMRALGARSRPLRRRLRRIAVGITLAGLAIGLPLGVVVANVIARMVLQEFVGITPDVGWSWQVVAVSAAIALIGARFVAARSARRVTALPLAEALRDRDGAPFGRRVGDRLVARLPVGGLRSRLALRSSAHRRARATAVVAQIAAGVGAVLVVIGLTVSVNDFNGASRAPWTWSSITLARDPGLPLTTADAEPVPGAEAGVMVDGEVDDWVMNVYGLDSATAVFDPALDRGRWIEEGTRDAVVSSGFARRTGLAVGDELTVEFGAGPSTYTVVGTADDHARAVYLDRLVLADDLGTPGGANVVWSPTAITGLETSVETRTSTAAQLDADETAARRAIVLIFGAIGAVVAVVAGLAVTSTMGVNLYERRHELAALQAIGGGRRDVRRLVTRELVPLAVVGIGVGVLTGWWGTIAIIGSFEASNAIDIGARLAVTAVPVVAAATVAGVAGLAAVAARRSARRPIAATLRGAV